jgi:hypothetical protein
MKYLSFITICLLVVTVVACKRNVVSGLDLTDASGNAQLKIVYASAYTTNYSAQLKVNNQRVSNNITYTTPFPGGGLNTGGSSLPWYLSLRPGPTDVTLSVPKAGTTDDSILLAARGIGILQPNVYYTAYLADTATNTQAVVITENVAEPSNGTSRFKFVNLIPNQPFVDLYFGTTKVAVNIPYKTASPEFTLAYNSAGQWAIRAAGASPTSTALAVYPTGTGTQTIPNKRIFTVFSRGYSGGTGNKVPAVSLLYN